MGKSPRKGQDNGRDKGQDAGEEKEKGKRGGAVIRLRLPTAPPSKAVKHAEQPAEKPSDKPIRLKLKLSKSADEVPPAAVKETRITPKLTLSLRRPAAEPVPPANVPKKRGRKPGSKLKKSASAESTSDVLVLRRGFESAPASAKGNLAGSAGSMQAIAPKVASVPVYSDEDRITRQAINEVIQEKVAGLQGHVGLWDKPVCSPTELINVLWPFYEQLAVTEITSSALYRAAGHPAPVARQRTPEEECRALAQRFDELCLADRQRHPRSTELVVLEHRLCLEEEKFLYAKLKSEYYTHYSSIGGSR